MVLGPKEGMSSGLGGLGLEGMVGSEDSVGESSPLPGEGKRGVISGDEAGGEESGGAVGSNAGAAEIVFAAICADDKWEVEKERRHKATSKMGVDDGAIE